MDNLSKQNGVSAGTRHGHRSLHAKADTVAHGTTLQAFALTGHLQVALAMVTVGSSVVVGKIVSSHLPVFLTSFIRFVIAAACMLPLCLLMRGGLRIPTRREWVLLGVQSLFGVFLFSVCLLYGLQRTSALAAGITLGMLPAVNALLSVLVLRESLTPRALIGIGLSVAGAVLLELRSGTGSAEVTTSLTGLLLVLGAVACEALFSVIGKLSGGTQSPMSMTTWIILIGVVLFAPAAMHDAMQVDFAAVPASVWWLLAYYGVVVTVVGFSLFYLGLSKISAVAAGVHMSWAPLSAMVIAAIVLGEPVGWQELAAGLCVLAAVLSMSVPMPARRSRHAAVDAATR
ncbi:MAG TPA: DMT family transporter [Burkholderiaceae bacterium]|nr:DMT family transporter [Burkholderiaceae bacterium]